uniref:hypothetical protein n=1 Tax=Cupriavidus necator TaxID=106590 RepID=UPI003F49298A
MATAQDLGGRLANLPKNDSSDPDDCTGCKKAELAGLQISLLDCKSEIGWTAVQFSPTLSQDL